MGAERKQTEREALDEAGRIFQEKARRFFSDEPLELPDRVQTTTFDDHALGVRRYLNPPHAILGLVRELLNDYQRRHGRPPLAILLTELERAALLRALNGGHAMLLGPDEVFEFQGVNVLCSERCVRISGTCAWHGPSGEGCSDTAVSGDLCQRHRSIVTMLQEPLKAPERMETP